MTSRSARRLISLVALMLPTAAAAGPERLAPTVVGVPGGHAHLSRERPRGTLWPRSDLGGRRQPVKAADPIVDREVMGYLPYWEMDYDFPRWDLLTTLAWFSVDLDASGQAVAWHGWGETATADLVAEAHAHGVRVVVTVALFGNDQIGALLTSPSARQTAVETCLSAIALHDADGVNIDFESVPIETRDEFTAFMTALKAAVAASKPNGEDGHVTLAGPAVDWAGSYDYDQLLIHTDGIMVMAYDYHWTGGAPGPVAPLTSGTLWSKWNVSWTIEDYLFWGKQENRHKLYLGLPLYGRRWPVTDTSVPSAYLGDGEAVLCSVAREEAESTGYTWDTHSQTPYYHQQDGQLWQIWFEDQESFGLKIAAAVEAGLGGIGLWALGYDGDDMAEWLEIEDQLVGLPPLVPKEDASTGPLRDASTGEGTDSDVGPDLEEASSAASPETVAQTRISSLEVVGEGCDAGGGSPGPWGTAAILLLYLNVRRARWSVDRGAWVWVD